MIVEKASKHAEPKFFYELLRLIDNAYIGDKVSITREVETIAEKFENKGFHQRAEKLRTKAERFKRNRCSGLSSLESSSLELGCELFYPKEAATKARDFIPTPANKIKIHELIQVVKKKEAFWEAEIPIPNKIIMFGPPGTGKTVSAHYIASVLNLPLLLVRLDTLISSSLGGTANNLRKAFDAANKQPCVFFLDEFDAIATNRNLLKGDGAENEMKRVVNSLLQNLDALSDEVMLFAATNLDHEIDPAVWRRFHNRMNFELPNEEAMFTYLSKQLDDTFLIHDVLGLFLGKSFAEVELALNKAKTKCILRAANMSKELIFESIDEILTQRSKGG